MLGLIDVRRPQVADQQLIAAEDIERQKAVVVIIAVEKATLLAAVHRIVRTIEVQHQFLRRLVIGGDEALHQRLMRRPSPAPVRRPLQTANRRGTGQTPIPTASRCNTKSSRRTSWSLTSSSPSEMANTRWRSKPARPCLTLPAWRRSARRRPNPDNSPTRRSRSSQLPRRAAYGNSGYNPRSQSA